MSHHEIARPHPAYLSARVWTAMLPSSVTERALVTDGPCGVASHLPEESGQRGHGCLAPCLAPLALIATPPTSQRQGERKRSGHEPALRSICVGVAQSLALWGRSCLLGRV